MCVIAYSPKHKDIPTDEQLTTMWEANPNGAGYAYISKGKVHYSKGFMKLDDLLEDLATQREAMKHREFAIHFRITTAGSTDAPTTHPFPITTEFHELRTLKGTADAVLFHNGVLDDGGISDPRASDTQDFVIAIAPLLARPIKSKTRRHFIEEWTKGNRLLVFYGTGVVQMYGDWKKDGDLFVSNTYYKPTTSAWEGYYSDYYKYYSTTKPTEAQLTEADEALAKLAEEQYAQTTLGGLKALKYMAEEVTTAEMIFEDGIVLGYDETSCIVWLEDSPIITQKKEYDAIYG